jgi:hypothetical protein
MKLLRVLRGILGTAVAWGLAWIPLTLVTWGVAGVLGGNVPPLRVTGAIVIGAAIRGMISGAAFASVLALAGRRRTFENLRLRDMLVWGAIGGIVAPVISLGAIALTTSAVIPPLAIGLGLGMASTVGALSAAGTLWVARKAPELRSQNRALLDSEAGTA